MIKDEILSVVRNVADFPKPGILFKDITPILQDPALSERLLDALAAAVPADVNAIAGIESRGFLFGLPLAMRLGLPFIPIRKSGKLPYETVAYSYELEYGHATIEMHADALERGHKVLIHDDLLATGGTAKAAAELVIKVGGQVAGFSFILGLESLNGMHDLTVYSRNITILAPC
ncbi:MAG: adenine phosphoribosyltransferase [Cryomorphaceae bacterium]|nr:adenine phosphoribosyltransferase [Cryomorphaceae bacterium]